MRFPGWKTYSLSSGGAETGATSASANFASRPGWLAWRPVEVVWEWRVISYATRSYDNAPHH